MPILKKGPKSLHLGTIRLSPQVFQEENVNKNVQKTGPLYTIAIWNDPRSRSRPSPGTHPHTPTNLHVFSGTYSFHNNGVLSLITWPAAVETSGNWVTTGGQLTQSSQWTISKLFTRQLLEASFGLLLPAGQRPLATPPWTRKTRLMLARAPWFLGIYEAPWSLNYFLLDLTKMDRSKCLVHLIHCYTTFASAPWFFCLPPPGHALRLPFPWSILCLLCLRSVSFIPAFLLLLPQQDPPSSHLHVHCSVPAMSSEQITDTDDYQ